VPLSDDQLQRRTRILLTLTLVSSSLVGAAVAFTLANFVIPTEAEDTDAARLASVIAVAVYLPLAVLVGSIWGTRRAEPIRAFLREGREPTPDETRAVLRGPLRVTKVVAVLWGGAVVLFGILNAFFSIELAVNVALTVSLGGIATCAVAYLLAERLLRPTAARAMASGAPVRVEAPGVVARGVIFWGLGTAIPLVGLIMVALGVLVGDEPTTETQLAILILALGGLALLVGLGVGLLAARAVADPIASVRDALAEVEGGKLDVEVPVYDASEVGLLQAGFNRMVAGLRERERIRETFGTYVDPEVAEHILEGGAGEGSEVEVTLLFLDVRDFTGFAERAAPREVVSTLNRLFECVVPVIAEHGGHVDKFIGDGLLAVFGAPRPAADHADRAMAAAREIARLVREGFGDELAIGIGLNSGTVVAGSIGGAGRLEFSVIGDAVNVAARVEAATRETGDEILLSEGTRERLSDPGRLIERPGMALKGKSEPVTLYAPAD
jgi:adenylate cyclase